MNGLQEIIKMNKEAKIDKQKLDQIVEVITDNLEYSVETMGYNDYDVTAYLEKKYEQRVLDIINEILEE